MHIAIIGATGAVGTRLIDLLASRNFPVTKISLFASPASEGRKIPTVWGEKYCQTLKKGCFENTHMAFFDAHDSVSQEWVPHALSSGCYVIDNSAVFRLDPHTPLIVPEINPEKIGSHKLISGPNCSTVQLVLALFPLHKAFGLKRVVVCTYQSASGAGSSALLELKEHTKRHLQDHPLPPSAYFAHPLAFNCIPQIGRFDDSGYTSEEQKLMNETKKILDHSNLLISATAVRVPTQFCHAESVMLECENDFSQQDLINALEDQPGVCLSPKIEDYPVPLNAANQNAVFIGRVRKDLQIKKTAHLWIVSDNLIKGAALNALQIGERLLPFFPH